MLYKRMGGQKIGTLLLLLQALCMVGFALSSDFIVLCILRLLQGVVATGMTVFVRTIINDLCNEENRGVYNGYISSSDGAGMILVLGCLSWNVDWGCWRSLLYGLFFRSYW
nr:MFS transporter [Paenibacillus herberti]